MNHCLCGHLPFSLCSAAARTRLDDGAAAGRGATAADRTFIRSTSLNHDYAIDAALAPLYPGVTPLHFGTLIKWSLGGPDPLDGISVYERADHWHLVSYGMSEL